MNPHTLKWVCGVTLFFLDVHPSCVDGARGSAVQGEPLGSPRGPKGTQKEVQSCPKEGEMRSQSQPKETNESQNYIHINKIRANSQSTAIQRPTSIYLVYIHVYVFVYIHVHTHTYICVYPMGFALCHRPLFCDCWLADLLMAALPMIYYWVVSFAKHVLPCSL